MNEGPTLAYEQPLRPGEARLDVGRESVTIAWRLSGWAAQKEVIASSFWLAAIGAGIAAPARWSRHHIDTVNVSMAVLGCTIWLLLLIDGIRLGKSALVIFANNEALSRTMPSMFRKSVRMRMADVREFAVDGSPNGYTLIARGHRPEDEGVRWYQFRYRTGDTSFPVTLLTHTDPVFAYRAAHALNALLAPADDLAATPFSPPPPSPDPPS